MKTAAIILAAGRGERAGNGNGPKQYRSLGSKSVLRRSVEAFAGHPAFGPLVVAIHADDRALCTAALGDLLPRVEIVVGGATRQASTQRALDHLQAGAPDLVLIHDAARPFLEGDVIDRVLQALHEAAAVVPAMPVSDTIKRIGENSHVLETVHRDDLHAAQTPQGFRFSEILAAHRSAAASGGQTFTDDAAIAAWAGMRVCVVRGSAENTKLTWARDIALAEARYGSNAMFPDVRTGNGYDVHAFQDGDAVILCGVEIAHDRKLSGHSDADVGLHALTDALLATCGAGDIGTHFPPSDPQWRGAASRRFVEHAARLVRENGGRIANADVTLICEAPKIGPHREAMVKIMSEMLGIDAGRVSIKATTNEKLGFVGRAEGIAAIATTSVIFPGSVPE
ncbi:bifunctional 2-C-methyl-D-erythritol 4-phosphate cytidylyltransferase/2-C-methyl-D-erythritol 2,4-cyclodiphosphate synthase [Tianweitania sediminis]|uniref:Bifunctional enzyme IspD/IspF n=1 Tax=Tianweitania sediminis TaxID=1502156 RepID=A0A8J7R5L2_9HYPH|nr:bifunctional 2-C-methyl-D-erythritol 4-phosphate cytidylyltransferase/2-C-methyl-D-erythritol 2,4-cyclodiphosphate synthase [Tianweitania sediminis]MBP0440245.1 bifunctional 2-C-methyl-D-erythritol 4-phosphate cytidylyltransferase/2-C-methyl-D-erythritol 2,4-cyclodiphosphate synthase [Tianweitania sediminis]